MPGKRTGHVDRLLRLILPGLLWGLAAPGGAADPLPGTTIVQRGGQVVRDGEVFVLRREPFVIVMPGSTGEVSLLATVAQPREPLPDTVIAPTGLVVAATALSLAVQSDPIALHDRLDGALSAQWGGLLEPGHFGGIERLRGATGAAEPILMNARQHPAFAGAVSARRQAWPIFLLDAEPVERSTLPELAIVLFRARGVTKPDDAWRLLDVSTLRLRFEGPATARSRGVGRPAPLDCGDSAIVRTVRDANSPRLERLLRDGLDPNLRSAHGGVTLLMCAVGGDRVHAESVRVLLEAGADPDLPSADGQTAVHRAVRALGGPDPDGERLASLEALLRHGGDVEAESEAGDTPLSIAIEVGSPEAVAMLLVAGADATVANRHGVSAGDLVAGPGAGDLRWLVEAMRSGPAAP